MGLNHVLVLPFPAQGHVNPLMHLSHKLVQHGCKVTFVNTEFNHKRVLSAMNGKVTLDGSEVELVSIADGLGPEDDRSDMAALISSMVKTMPSDLEMLIRDINSRDGGSNRITGMVCDTYMAWALEIAQKLAIKGAIIIPSSSAMLALEDNIPKLIEDGIMDSDGFPIKKGKFQLSPKMPNMNITDMPWSCFSDASSQKTIFHYLARSIQWSHLTDWWISNTTIELEPGALSLCPKILPIGPIKESPKFRSLGQFWQEDHSCLSWLDQQPPCSVIYVAFGSFTIFDPNQFKELALGLELTNRPFLWVVRDDSNGSVTKHKYPNEFQGTKGKIVKWTPQPMVLKHPSIACFVSHCGWNSTMDGVSNGVPFLCWPYFADQFVDKAYICDFWKVGLGFDEDEKGIISRWEIKKKVEQLLGDEEIKGRSKKMKDMIMNNIAKDGKSTQNFNKFMKWLNE
ncbi:UDP-glycosyltransferase 83A1-like [Arachis stenosperma]|uniref:UDP-glycosyltransferase 83A1-like n=1 Tax=Arachis stenosperma TaxID=217475 RepID=UPI0025AC4FA3|nr:UDP-glycosyltransferase 83A1-like [Arachis stenosperma]